MPSAALALGTLHCSSTTTNNGSSGGGTDGGGGTTPGGARTGVTPCGSFPDSVAKSCQAGQHCSDDKFSRCDTGCLTDNNCPQAATCSIDTGTSAGAVSCDELCKHVQACAPTVTAAQCAQLCAGYNDACKSCILNANFTAPKNACDAQCR